MKYLLLMSLITSLFTFGGESLELNWRDFCRDHDLPASRSYSILAAETKVHIPQRSVFKVIKFCNSIKNNEHNYEELPTAAIQMPQLHRKIKSPQQGWSIRFNFSFARTNYFVTDLNVKSSSSDLKVHDIKFKERTTASFYNPANWDGIEDMLRWIDEPSNAMEIAIEKDRHVFLVNVFHPKFLTNDASESVHRVSGRTAEGEFDEVIALGQAPLNLNSYRFTYRNLNVSVGYGYQINLFNRPGKKLKLIYTPMLAAGINMGPGFLRTNDGDEIESKKSFSKGLNATIGHRLETRYKRTSLFIDQKLTYGSFKHEFPGATVSYKMGYSPITFGVGYQILSFKRRSKTK